MFRSHNAKKTFRFRDVLIVLCGIHCSIPLSAQIRQDSVTYTFPYEIVVTAPRVAMQVKDIPLAASIVDQRTLRALPRGIGFEEPMLLVPGVKVDNQANGSRIHLSIRGQGILSERGIRGIRILQDGIPMNDPTGFAPDVFDIDYSIVERIEVLRGPAASMYGGSASGGVINVLTHKNSDRLFSGEASALMGSNGYWRASAMTNGGSGDISYLASFSRAMGDGYRVHTHFQGNNAYLKLRYTPTASLEITPLFGWSRYYHENPEGINLEQYTLDPLQANPDAVPYNEYLSSDRKTYGLNGAWEPDERQELRFSAYTKNTRFVEANNRTFTHRHIQTPGVSAQYTRKLDAWNGRIRNTLGFGADLQWQQIDEHRNANRFAVEDPQVLSSERIEQRGIGVFLLNRLEIGDTWTFLLSLRYDNIHNELEDLMRQPYDLSGSADFHRVTARAGATYALARDLFLFAGWGQGFLPPATEELAQNPDHFGGFNTHLSAATSNSFELGTRGRFLSAVNHEITLFYLTTGNDFDRYRISDPLRNQETFYRNVGSSRRIGLELAASYAVLRNLDLRVAYTWSDFRYTVTDPIPIMMDDTTIHKYIRDGNSLPNCPAHQVGAEVEFRPTSFLTLAMSMLAMSKYFIDGANIESEAVPAYHLLNARIVLSGSLVGLSGDLIFSLRNITDTKYVAFSEPDPGGNSYQPGSGREFFGGIRVRL